MPMNNHDNERFVELMTILASAYHQEADRATLEAYSIGLSDVPITAIETAVYRAIRGSTFFPSVAELRELAGEMKPEARAIKAWDAFCKARGSYGYYVTVDFDDPVINATVRNLGGWMAVDDRIDEEGDKWVRKDFERVYMALMSSGVSASEAMPLIGFHEQNNRFLGQLTLRDGKPAIKPPQKVITGLPPHRQGVLAQPIPTEDVKELSGDTRLLKDIGCPIGLARLAKSVVSPN